MNKFEDLLSRFEGLLNRFEGGPGPAPAKGPAEEEKGASAPAAQVHPLVAEFDKDVMALVPNVVAKGKAIGHQVTNDIAEGHDAAFKLWRTLLVAVTQSAWPKNDKDIIREVYYTRMQEIVKKATGKRPSSNDKDFDNHQKTANDGFEMLSFMLADAPKDYLDEEYQAIDYFGNRVRQLGKDEHTAWYTDYKKLATAFHKFAKAKLALSGLPWKNGGGDFKEAFEKELGAGGEAKPAAPKNPMAGVLAGIKGASEEAPKNPMAGVLAGIKGGAPEEKKAPVNRFKKEEKKKEEKKKSYVRDTHFLDNYEKETVTFEGEQEVDKHIGFYIAKAKRCNFIIKGKCKGIVLSGCTSCTLHFDDCVGGLELVNSKEIQVWAKGSFSSCAFEKTTDCTLYLTQNNKDAVIRSTASTTSSIRYPKVGATEEDELLEINLPEVFVTKIENDKEVTVPVYD